jgi:hypothetical protein
MGRRSVVIRLVSIFIAIAGLSEAQQSGVAPNGPRGGPLATATVASQNFLDTPLHQRAVAAGGKLTETHEANVADLAADLPSLTARSDEVLLVHLLTSHGGVSAAGDRVQSHYDVQVLRSWKGPHIAGDVITFFVPAGGFLFHDGIQAERSVRSFSALFDGGRYVLFLRSSAVAGQSDPSLWLVGDGVQGAFLLTEEKVRPVYQQGPLWQNYNQRAVSALLTELDASLGLP